MSKVGIIANPASGKDIRRLVAYGTVFDNQEKVNIVRRVLLALTAVGVEEVIYMPDYFGIVPKAADGIGSRHRLSMDIVSADIELTGTQEDSYQAALEMKRSGVGCIITLGGDGTNRMVAKGCGEIPILPISTGTNNVFPEMIEGTTAGLAAGVVAKGWVSEAPAIHPTKKLVIFKNGIPVDIALIDAVILKDTFIGSRAVWDAERIRQVVVTRGETHNIGISSIAGVLEPVGVMEENGLVIEVEQGEANVLAPIAPGLVEPLRVKDYRHITLNEEIKVTDVPCLIALDGEREVEVREGDQATIQLTFDGPKVIDMRAALQEAALRGCFQGDIVAQHVRRLKEEV